MSDRLIANVPVSVDVKKVVGGLAPDSTEPMAPELQDMLRKTWQRIHDMLGTEFNFDFWTQASPRRSTYAACRAVLTAGLQGRDDDMIDAIQNAYYLRAMNPSDVETLEQLAEEIGLQVEEFQSDIRSEDVENMLKEQVEFTRRSLIDGFPSLALEIGDRLYPVARDYRDHESSLAHIEELLSGAETVP